MTSHPARAQGWARGAGGRAAVTWRTGPAGRELAGEAKAGPKGAGDLKRGKGKNSALV